MIKRTVWDVQMGEPLSRKKREFYVSRTRLVQGASHSLCSFAKLAQRELQSQASRKLALDLFLHYSRQSSKLFGDLLNVNVSYFIRLDVSSLLFQIKVKFS